MIEMIMYFGIGFLAAALIALLFFPLVHNRAVRLTMRRLEAATPLTIAEIRADKDQLRAEFAMATRRLEMNVEQMKAKTTAQLAELGKKNDAVNQLRKELGEKTATIFSLEERDKTIIEQMRTTEEEHELKSSSLREAERIISEKEAELSKLIAELGDQSISADSQRVELAAMRAQVEAMKFSAAEYERNIKGAEEKLMRERGTSAAATSDLTDARGKLDGLNTRVADLEKQLAAQAGTAEALSKGVAELEATLSEKTRLLTEREEENQRLRGESDQLRPQLAAGAMERTKLQAEIAKLQQEAEAASLVRDRVSGVAAEVARLTAALEGPGSPIATMISNGAGGGRGSNGSGDKAGSAGEQKGTLADRIRALQSSVSRQV
jgi:chromosome segregation ATPase